MASAVGLVTLWTAFLLLIGTSYGQAQCQQDLMACQPLVTALNDRAENQADFLRKCQTASEAKRCVDGVDSCKNVEGAKDLSTRLENVIKSCSSMTANGACNDAVECILSAMSNANGPNEACGIAVNAMSCLQRKSATGSCTIDESKITFAEVQTLTAGVCPDNRQCAIANREVPGLQGEGNNIPQMTDPGLYCRLMSNYAASYASHGTECGLSAEEITAMQARYRTLKEKCPAAPSKGARRVPEVMCVMLTMLLALWLALA